MKPDFNKLREICSSVESGALSQDQAIEQARMAVAGHTRFVEAVLIAAQESGTQPAVVQANAKPE